MAAVLKLLGTPSTNVGQIPPLRADDDGNLDPTLLLRLYSAVQALIERFNGQISLGTGNNGERSGNISGQYINVQTPVAADVEFAVPHGLGRTPIGCIIAYCEKPVVVYASGNAWNSTSLYLKASGTFLSPDANAQMRLWVW